MGITKIIVDISLNIGIDKLLAHTTEHPPVSLITKWNKSAKYSLVFTNSRQYKFMTFSSIIEKDKMPINILY